MLTNGFYNLAERKNPPVVRVDACGGDVQVTFTDSAGDELQVRLCTQTCAEVFAQIAQLGWPEFGRALRAKFADQITA